MIRELKTLVAVASEGTFGAGGNRVGLPAGLPGVVLDWRRCFAGVAGESLSVRATESNQRTRVLRRTAIHSAAWVVPAALVSRGVVARSTLLRAVSQGQCLALTGC